MPEVSADAETLMRQAPMTANLYLINAVRDIDGQLGAGFAKKNPQLVSAYLHVCAQDFHTAITKAGMQELASAVRDLASALETRHWMPTQSPDDDDQVAVSIGSIVTFRDRDGMQRGRVSEIHEDEFHEDDNAVRVELDGGGWSLVSGKNICTVEQPKRVTRR